MTDLIREFEEAVAVSKTITARPSTDTLLNLYSLYKQALHGDVNTEPPGALDFIGKAKYEAWSALKGLSQEEAMKRYINLIEKLRS